MHDFITATHIGLVLRLLFRPAGFGRDRHANIFPPISFLFRQGRRARRPRASDKYARPKVITGAHDAERYGISRMNDDLSPRAIQSFLLLLQLPRYFSRVTPSRHSAQDTPSASSAQPQFEERSLH